MDCKNCKIVCDGKEIAAIGRTKDGLEIKATKEGREMLKSCCKEGCC